MEISEIVGKIFTEINVNKDNDEIAFVENNGSKYIMRHDQDCCEIVQIDDINGSLDDLINTPITFAEESTNSEDAMGRSLDSFTWTFYKLASVKGYVNIKWLGESNGYYSESVDFIKLG